MSKNTGFQIKPIPDETFLGLVVTAGILTGCATYSQAYRGILGKLKTCPASLLPRGLDQLSSYLPDRYQENVEAICYEHTALPYFHHFSKPEALSKVKEAMVTSKQLNIHNAIGLTNTAIREGQWLKYCSTCANEHWAVYRRATWLRSHQLPGVEVCYKHGLPLIESSISTVRYGAHSGQIELPPLSEFTQTRGAWSIGDAWDKSSPNRLIAQLSHELLTRQPLFSAPRSIGKVYRAAYIAAGCNRGKAVDREKVARKLRETYGDLIPRKLGIDFTPKSPSHWTRRITLSQDGIQHPMQHILVIGMLFDSLNQLESALSEASAKISCSASALDENSNLLNTAKRKINKEPVDQQKLELHRQTLAHALALHPHLTRNELRIKVGYTSYDWILRNDRGWAESHLPPKNANDVRVGGSPHSSPRPYNWVAHDEKLAAEILNLPPNVVVRKFKNEYLINNAQLARITKLSYFRIRKLISLPRTNAALNSLCIRAVHGSKFG